MDADRGLNSSVWKAMRTAVAQMVFEQLVGDGSKVSGCGAWPMGNLARVKDRKHGFYDTGGAACFLTAQSHHQYPPILLRCTSHTEACNSLHDENDDTDPCECYVRRDAREQQLDMSGVITVSYDSLFTAMELSPLKP